MSSPPRKFYVATFGCRTNQADSAAIREGFLDGRFEEAERWEEADVIVVNSCTVTHRSDQQVRQLTRRFRRDNPQARIIVTGCYAQRDPRQLARIPAVDAVVGNTRKHDIVAIAGELGKSPPSLTYGELAAIYRDDFGRLRAIDWTPATPVGGRTRPFVKIQDGCDSRCAYCIIPAVRGPSRSVPPQQVLEQIRRLSDRGFQEIVLTGIHLGTYGRYLEPRYSLDRLLEEIVEVPGLRRLRLSSIEPMELSRRIIDLAARCHQIAPHFHICLQSGSDRVLKAMRRPYRSAQFASILEEIRHRLPEAGIGTDVIAGFPGETKEDHRRTLEFVRRMPFTYLHVFPYSDRSGTEASRMSGKVDGAVKRLRVGELLALSEEKNRAFRQSFVGRRLSVLTLADLKDGLRCGVSGNYLKVKLDPAVRSNRIVEAEVVRDGEDDLIVTWIPQACKGRFTAK